MPLDAHAVGARSGLAVGRRRDVVLPGRLPEQRCRAALAVVEPEDFKVERVDPRCERLSAAVVADCRRSPVALADVDRAWSVERSRAVVEGSVAITVVAGALLGDEARQSADREGVEICVELDKSLHRRV